MRFPGLQEEEGEGEKIYISKLSHQQYLINAHKQRTWARRLATQLSRILDNENFGGECFGELAERACKTVCTYVLICIKIILILILSLLEFLA